ncbi:MAG: SprB repeat-containing protein [Bacteroidales bacterium]|nr:SprB repeat-containing protein [Bacteroidales bacterium]
MAIEGTSVGLYKPGSKELLLSYIKQSQTVYDDLESSQTTVDASKLALQDVVEAFKNSKITEESVQENKCGLVVNAEIIHNKCFGGEEGSVKISVSGGVEPYMYRWSNDRTSVGIYNMPAGFYTVEIVDSTGCSAVQEYEIKESQEIQIDAMITSPLCGYENGAIRVEVTGGNSPYVCKWIDSDSIVYNVQNLENLPSKTYTIMSKLCKNSKTFQLSDEGAPVITLEEIMNSNCDANTGAIVIDVTGGAGGYSYLWNDTVKTKNRLAVGPGEYSLIVTDIAGCKSSFSATVTTKTMKQPEIALVTYGEESRHNLVVWQKEETKLIDFYTVYRESTSAGEYDRIGTVSYKDLGLFVDEDADVEEQAWRYRLTASDFCGNETSMSKEHKTIFLQKNIGLTGEVNLIWDAYEGVDYSSYLIYRKTLFGIEQIAQVSSRNVRYSDKKPALGTIGYFVAVQMKDTIDITKPLKSESGPFVMAISNIAEVENVSDNIVSVSESSAMVRVQNMNVIVENSGINDVELYDIKGCLISKVSGAEKSDGYCVIPVKLKGVYIVIVGKQVFEVLVK